MALRSARPKGAAAPVIIQFYDPTSTRINPGRGVNCPKAYRSPARRVICANPFILFDFAYYTTTLVTSRTSLGRRARQSSRCRGLLVLVSAIDAGINQRRQAVSRPDALVELGDDLRVILEEELG